MAIHFFWDEYPIGFAQQVQYIKIPSAADGA